MLSPKTNTFENEVGTVRSSNASTPNRTEAALRRLGIRAVDGHWFENDDHIFRLLSRNGLRSDESGSGPGAQTGRPGWPWPVRRLLGGYASPAAFRGRSLWRFS